MLSHIKGTTIGWKHFIVVSLMLFTFLTLFGTYAFERFRLGFDVQKIQCIHGARIYIIDTFDKKVVKNAIYAFKSKGLDPFYPDGTQLVKYARALPGDTVSVNARAPFYVSVNDKIVASGLDLVDRLNQPLKNFIGSKQLKANEFFMLGDTRQSFDSRYWGSIQHQQIIGRVYGII